MTADAFVPLSFAPGEAYQFGWSHEVVLINGVTNKVKVAQAAHVRLDFAATRSTVHGRRTSERSQEMSDHLSDALINVEIEVNSRCNRRCWYCPVSVLPFPDTPKFMDDSVFVRLHEELRSIGYAGRISYHLLSEPLLRRDLPRLVALSKSMLPRTRQVLFTNGDLLTDERYDALLRAGVDLIVITSHDGVPPKTRDRQFVQFPVHLELTNRGGAIEALPSATTNIIALPCHAPSEMLIVTSKGDVLLCYEDARRENVYGNIMRSSLEEIWSNPDFIERRRLLNEGRRSEAGGICLKCSNFAHATPGRSASSEPFWAGLGAS